MQKLLILPIIFLSLMMSSVANAKWTKVGKNAHAIYYVDFEKIKKQEVKFNINIGVKPSLTPIENKINNIVNYETVIKNITKLTKNKHYELLESLAEDIFCELFKNNNIQKINLKIEKTQIIKNTSSVGVEITKERL